jgi:hypothetical protein
MGENAVRRALRAIVELLNFVYVSGHKKKLPAHIAASLQS